MINADDLKEGDLIWWTAERYCKDWDVPAIYRGVEKANSDNPWSSDKHKIESLDDGAITNIGKDTVEKEITISNARQHKHWLQNKIHAIDGVILQLNQKIGDQEIKKQEIIARMNSYNAG